MYYHYKYTYNHSSVSNNDSGLRSGRARPSARGRSRTPGWPVAATDVCANKQLLRKKKTLGSISSNNIDSGAGEQSLPLACRGKARAKGMFCSQTPVALDANHVVISDVT